MIRVKPTEENLVLAIVQTLNLTHPGTFCWRMETRGIPKAIRRDGRIVAYKVDRNHVEKGKPDISGVTNSLGWVMEVKLPGNYLTPDQADWIERYEHRGKGRAALCRSVDEAEAFVRGLTKETRGI